MSFMPCQFSSFAYFTKYRGESSIGHTSTQRPHLIHGCSLVSSVSMAIRLPPFQIFFSEDAHCLCIKIPIFPTSVILKSYQRLSPDLSVPENTSALRKMMGTLAAIFTVFLFHFYRSSAFHTPGTGYRPDLSGTLRTDQPVFFFQYLMTQRAFFRVKHVQ